MKNRVFLAFLLVLSSSAAMAKIGNTREQNNNQYGAEMAVEDYGSKDPNKFTGYITYAANSEWALKAFFKKGLVRVEHLIPEKANSRSMYNREEVKQLAEKMFDTNVRGAYQRQVNFPRAEGHFFNKGLVVYEYFMDGNKLKGYKGVKVLLYENDASFNSVNPKAYL